MNDAQKAALGVVGTVTSFILEHVGPVAPTLAAMATAAFMAVSVVDKIRSWRSGK